MSSKQKKSFVTRDAFLNSPLPFEDVDLARCGIPAWVRVNALNAAQLGEYGVARAEVPEELRGSVLLVFTLSDNAGQALFTMDDLDALERTNGAAYLHLLEKSLAINGMGDPQKAAENLANAQSSNSDTD